MSEFALAMDLVMCPTCGALVRVVSYQPWGAMVARHLARGSWCSQGEHIETAPRSTTPEEPR